MSNQVDTRAFSYTLGPILTQQQWKLDAAQIELGKAQHSVNEAQDELDKLKAAYQENADLVRESLARTVELSRYRQALEFITQIRRQIKNAEDKLHVLIEERDNIRAICTAQQKKIETIEQHREDCLGEFITAEQNRLSSEADRDWVARLQWQVQMESGTGKLIGPGKTEDR